MSNGFSRRQVLKGGGVIALGFVTPSWLASIARGDLLRRVKGSKPGDTVLVVCQFSGGNDGLNMVPPYADAEYYKLRPTLAIPDSKALKLDDHMAFHPSMTGLHTLYQQGKVAVIQNVGYPHPNRSHFRSMDIWQSAAPDTIVTSGWLGRHFDEQFARGVPNPVFALGLSTEVPLALAADHVSIPCFASLADVESMVGDPDTERLLRLVQGREAPTGSGLESVQKANQAALGAVETLHAQLGKYEPKGDYGKDAFGVGFRQIAQIVATSPATRLIYFSAGGFDTHARQADTQARLLGEFSDAVFKFQSEMETLHKADNVVVFVFSEFGRRSYENASQGTDHGAAAPSFLIGSKVKGGLHGPVPDLSDLDAGDLKYHVDFRQLYATSLDEWMGGDSEVVLGQKFDHLPVFQ